MMKAGCDEGDRQMVEHRHLPPFLHSISALSFLGSHSRSLDQPRRLFTPYNNTLVIPRNLFCSWLKYKVLGWPTSKKSSAVRYVRNRLRIFPIMTPVLASCSLEPILDLHRASLPASHPPRLLAHFLRIVSERMVLRTRIPPTILPNLSPLHLSVVSS